jgi:F420-0:gamma-glutamyl ligase
VRATNQVRSFPARGILSPMAALSVRPIQTRTFAKGENLAEFVATSVPRELVTDKMLVAVTSKIVSLSENRTVPVDGIDKDELIRREADELIGEGAYGVLLTRKEGQLIASAGIDESNSADGAFILYPKDPYMSAYALWRELRAAWNLKNLGLILTDSKTSMLRQGVTGMCLAHWGFRGHKNIIGQPDLFGRKMKTTKINQADSLAAAAVLTMGEASESRPIAVIRYEDVEFTEEVSRWEVRMPHDEDLYWPFLRK